jgi:Bacterial Ig-like domain/RTX calcium-binding nonapeptide repeat (4 copies)
MVTAIIANETISTTVGSDGRWSLTPSVALPDGEYVATITTSDVAGNVSEPMSVQMTIDTSPPSLTITSPVSQDDVINQTEALSWTLQGTTSAEAGRTVTLTIRDDNPATADVSATAVVQADGSWEATGVDLSGLENGTVTVLATVTDRAGNVSAEVSATAVLDQVAPPPPTVDSVLTNSSLPTITGSTGTGSALEPGEQLTVTVAGARYAVTPDASGQWTLDLQVATPLSGSLTALTEGPYDVQASVTDASGNTSDDTTLEELRIDLSPSTAATVTSLVTNSVLPVITGTTGTGAALQLGESLVVSVHGASYSVVPDSNGLWSLDLQSAVPVSGVLGVFADASYSVQATVTDAAGNAINDASVGELEVDTLAPTAPTVNVTTTNDLSPVLSGTTGTGAALNAGEVLRVTVNDATYVVVPNASGMWSLDLANAVPESGSLSAFSNGNQYSVTARVSDAAGNAPGVDTTVNELRIDTSAPTAPTVNVLNTNDVSPVLSGTSGTGAALGAGETLRVSVNGASYVVVPDGSGVWSLDLGTAVPEAGSLGAFQDATQYSVTATVTDAAGNTPGVDATANELQIDTTPPSAPTVHTQNTNNTSPILTGTSGTGAALNPGETLTVLVHGASYVVVPDASGAWSLNLGSATPLSGTLGALVNGTQYNVVATVTDLAGNTPGVDASSNELVFDTVSPSAPTVNSLITNDLSPVLTGTTGTGAALNAGETLRVTVNGATFEVVPNAGGVWSLDLGSAVPASGSLGSFTDGGTYSVTAVVTDAAGNAPGTDPSTNELHIDTSAPTAPTVASQVTNDTTPILSGTTGTGAGLNPGEALRVVVNGATYLVEPNASGNWLLNLQSATPESGALAALSHGIYSVTATVTDAAGNTPGVDGTANELNIDTESPTNPTVATVITNDTSPVISGTTGTGLALHAGEQLQVTVNGASYLVVPNASGVWSVDLQTAIPASGTLGTFADGLYNVVAQITDAAGNAPGLDATSNELRIDTVAPQSEPLTPVPEDASSTVDLSGLDPLSPYVSGISTAQIISLPNQGSLFLADGTTQVTVGQTLDATQLSTLVYRSGTHNANATSLTVLATDVAGNSAMLNLPLAVIAVADPDALSLAPAADEVTTASSVLVQTRFNSSLALNLAAPATSADGFDQRARLEIIMGAMDTTQASTTTTDASSVSVAAFANSYMTKFTGLVYLTAGTYTTSTNGQNVDETVVVRLGGQTTLQVENWSLSPIQSTFVASETGYYTFDTYFMNFGGAGVLPAIHLSRDGGPATAVNSANFRLYRNVAELDSLLSIAGAPGLSDLQGSPDGVNGFYVTNAEGRGSAGDVIKLAAITVTPVDTDGSESNAITISNIPVGSTLTSGANSFVATVASQSVDVTSWNLATLYLTTDANAVGGANHLVVTSTATEASNGNIVSATLNLPFDISLNTRTLSATQGNDTVLGANGANRVIGGAGADTLNGGLQDDMIYGGSGGVVRNSGFEYWDLQSASITGGSGFIYQQFSADTVNPATGDGALGGWLTSNAPHQGTGSSNLVELLSTSNVGAANIPGAGRFSLDLSANETNGQDVYINQAVVTMPGQTYTLNVVMRGATNNSDLVDVLWGDVVIARISSDATTSVTTYHGYAAPVVTQVLNQDGSPSAYYNYAFVVKGNIDAASTNLAIEADLVAGSDGRELLSVSLTPTVADGDDTLEGSYGSDVLFGQAGNDLLIGGVNGNSAADAGSVDVAVFSFSSTNGADTFRDFEVGTDRLYLVDVVDAFQGSGNWEASGDGVHVSRYPGNPSDSDANSTEKSDNNLTVRDFIYANDTGTTLTASGQNKQYITLSADGSGDLVIHFNTNGGAVGATNDAMGSVTLTGVKYGAGAGQYDSVADLFGGNGSAQLLWATTDGFKEPLTTMVFDGATVQDFDWTRMTNISGTVVL